MGNGDECLQRFGQLCRAFYESSLLLHTSSSSLSSIQEEKKMDRIPYDNEMKKKEADGKIVIETLNRISVICSIIVNVEHQHSISSLQESLSSLRHEHTLVVERHHDLLMECGLLDADRFMESSCSQNYGEEGCSLQKYFHVRDAMRRRAHKVSMLHRRNSFFELLSESSAIMTNPSESFQSRLTQRKNVQDTLSTIQNFVNKYQSNIGSHPFLAGLQRIVDLQLTPKSNHRRSSKDPSYVVRWKFHGSVLTEACRSCCGQDNGNGDDELAYAREAIQVMFSFLIWVKDIDVEGGDLVVPVIENEIGLDMMSLSSCQNDNLQEEPILSFEIDKYISNANLRRILLVLPNPKCLDARATGSVAVLDTIRSDPKTTSDRNDINVVLRKNADGHQDEQWPWFGRW
eukprot:CAMPEP_0172554902 /NCGR_PEP_ID=MMETSP1067-20121228/56935_1 /TAXON_ID=265564 ORGANISM="Thalassiosira punctigera, Strain Tpunct2005C2" /NCGR_SAMPLE_ID=MMETSP1067 /ASSEMBLY_ACC=CAM_ASM_000444 /LENGTH=401 /DNA_ID=CAMNT_0013343367 /DNA_START=190 /DNA_END=1392 /DNA_ORIENTATION=-